MRKKADIVLILTILVAAILAPFHLLAAPQGKAEAKQIVLKEQDVRQAVEALLEAKVSGRGWDTRITQLSVPSGTKIPGGQLDLEVIPPPRWDGWGPASMTVMLRVNGRLEKNISIRVTVEALADMVVAARQIQAGTILSRDDLLLQKQDLSPVNGRYVASIEDAAGKKIRGTARQGFPVRADQLEKVPVIKSGQMVTLLAESRSVRISTTGRARSSGAVGDVVMVQNLGSLREIPAKVLDTSTVVIGF